MHLTPSMHTALDAFLDSDHLSARTRDILSRRARAPSPSAPRRLSERAFAILRCVTEDLLPQDAVLNGSTIDLAAMIDEALGGPRDGWRFAQLPADLPAWEAGLLTLDAVAQRLHHAPYAELPPEKRGALLDAALDGAIGETRNSHLTPQQMKLWMGDLRAETVTCFLSHPVAQCALGLSAALTGGDEVFQGFQKVGPDEREDFEPKAFPKEARS